MNAEVLQTISIVAFVLAGLFALVSVVLFFRLDIRGIVNDLTGKTAERQIKELREQNHQTGNNKNGRVLYEPEQRKFTAKLENSRKKETAGLRGLLQKENEEITAPLQNAGEESTTLLAEEEGTTILANEEGTTLLAEEEGTTVLAGEEETTLLAEEGTTILGDVGAQTIRNGYRLVLDKIEIHTEEKI